MKSIEKATNNMKMVYSILCNLKKCTIFELQKLTKFRDVDLCLALGYLLQNNQIYHGLLWSHRKMKRDTIGLPHILLTCLHGAF